MKENLVGKTFHRLTVIGFEGKKGRSRLWRCKCKCGKEVLRTTSHLNENVKHSCGCRGWERHHLTGTIFYRKYQDAKNRCNNPNVSTYKYYGGKGIKFEWDSFEEFKNDMYESYLEHIKKFGHRQTTIDRIDNNKNYCKDNCRWATLSEQSNNRSGVYKIKYKGEIFSKTKLCKKLGISLYRVYNLEKKGVTFDEIIEKLS